MGMKKILLDTNAYSQLLIGNETVLNTICLADTVYMSVVVLGELYAGFHGGTKKQENEDILHRFLRKPKVKILNATIETSEFFAQIKNALKQAATPIPINDVWISAHALETGSTLVTLDKHFSFVKGLRLKSIEKK